MSGSNPLPAGVYMIMQVGFVAPDEPVRIRSVGLKENIVTVLPEGTEPVKWTLDPLPDGEGYRLSVDGKPVSAENSRVVAVPEAVDSKWTILRSAPHPPPVGNDMFAIYWQRAEPGSSAWFLPRELHPVPTPIDLEPIGYPFWIRPFRE